tara:strand:- start:579 stop:1685 length:1107 start_codon:yes stop_codon:yes gene_type:complete
MVTVFIIFLYKISLENNKHIRSKNYKKVFQILNTTPPTIILSSTQLKMNDPLNDTRICLLDGGVIRYKKLYAFYKTHISMIWTLDEIDLSQDAAHFKMATPKQQKLIKHILSFFSIADAIVMQNISENFIDAVKAPEAILFYSVQNFMEGVHADTYNNTIAALIRDPKEQQELLQNVPKYKSVQAKKTFAGRWMNSDRPFKEKLVAFAMVEGLLFSASFASIYWLKTLNLFPGLVQSNELISRDENLHCEFAIYLHSLLNNKCSEKTIHQIVWDAVETEKVFVEESISDGLDGLTRKGMAQYVEFLADRLLRQFGATPLFNVKFPEELKFMDLISVDNKGNFFEGRVSEYRTFAPVDAKNWTCELDDF